MVDIDQSVKVYYEQVELSEAQQQLLLAMRKDVVGSSGICKASLRKRASIFSVAAAASVMLVITLLVFRYSGELVISERVAQEIAMNHNKALAVEYQGDNYQVLSLDMDKLDFNLQAPQKIVDDVFTVTGARYCSIQGKIAAQVKLTDKKGRIYTLYQTRLSKEFDAIKNSSVQHADVRIRLWKESAILYGLAVENEQ